MLLGLLATTPGWASYLLLPMDQSQKNHLKAYGIAYWALQRHVEVDWLLNYQGGAFAFKQGQELEKELVVRGISFQTISDAQYSQILTQISAPESNMDVMKLEKAPKIAVYSPKSKQPWDDAVTLVLTYAEIPYDLIYDDDILEDKLPKYDWLHLHHEDFTGQQGKFYSAFRNAPWYIEQKRESEAIAKRFGFGKVPQLKSAVVQRIRDFCAGGGFMFAMCSATDTYDIALAAIGLDITESMFDGDPSDPQAQSKLNFDNTFAFKDFTLIRDPYHPEFSNIDNSQMERGLRVYIVTIKYGIYNIYTFGR